MVDFLSKDFLWIAFSFLWCVSVGGMLILVGWTWLVLLLLLLRVVGFMDKFSVFGVVKFVGALGLNALVLFGMCVGADFVLPIVASILVRG